MHPRSGCADVQVTVRGTLDSLRIPDWLTGQHILRLELDCGLVCNNPIRIYQLIADYQSHVIAIVVESSWNYE